MRGIFFLGSLAALVFGARHFGNYLSQQRKSRVARAPLEVWEGEGGAVPVDARRTAQQVSPRPASQASPPGVA